MSEFKFPKLPDQDDYLLDLQNNNYSMRTVYNYARDLCIFAMFIRSQGIKFEQVDKKSITLYKGYLRNGDHIRDLNEFREEVAMNAGIITEEGAKSTVGTAKDGASSSKGSRTNEKDKGAMLTPGSEEENDNFGRRNAETYLDDVYRKVYGSLGRLRTGSKVRSSNPRAGAGLDARSVNRMLSALRSYLKYRINFDLEVPIPPDAVTLIKADKKKKQVAQLDELVALIEAPTTMEKDERVGLRNRAMLEILFSTGMRISELISLDLSQINRDGKLFIEGKGRKQRFVYLTPRSMEWLDRYLQIRLRYVGIDDDPDKFDGRMPGEKVVSFGVEKGLDVELEDEVDRETTGRDVSRQGASLESNDRFPEGIFKNIDLLMTHQKTGYINKFYSPALFIPFSGGRNGRRGKRLSTNHFQEKIADYRRRLGIQVPTSAHSLRHGFATYLAENGASAAAIQVLLGHESLTTTTKYVHASDKFAQEQHRDKHPLNQESDSEEVK